MSGSMAAGMVLEQQLRASILIHMHKADRAYWECAFETAKPASGETTNETKLSNPFQTVLLTGDRVFKCMNLWGPFLSKPPPQPRITVEFSNWNTELLYSGTPAASVLRHFPSVIHRGSF